MVKNIKDLKLKIEELTEGRTEIGAIIDALKLIDSFEAEIRERIKVYERVLRSLNPNSDSESEFIIYHTFQKRIEELRLVLGEVVC